MSYSIWDIRNKFLKPQRAERESLQFSPDSKKIIYIENGYETDEDQIKLLDLTDGTLSTVTFGSGQPWSFTGTDVYVANPVFFSNGKQIAYSSLYTNLVPGDTAGKSDIFITDIYTKATSRVSTTSDGSEAFGGIDGSFAPAVSPDGKKVVFVSDATNLVSGDTNGAWDVFVKDLTTNTTTRVSVGINGQQANNQSGGHWGERVETREGRTSYWTLDELVATNSNREGPVFSPDGTKIAFSSYASNLVSGDSNGKSDIFVYDLNTKVIKRVSTASDGSEGFGGNTNGGSFAPKFSPDGTKLLFGSDFTNLVAGDTNNLPDIFVKDLNSGELVRVSTSASGGQSNGWSFSGDFSPDSKKVIFSSQADNLTPFDQNGSYGKSDVFIKDLKSGFIEQASRNYDTSQIFGEAFKGSVFSPDGKWLALNPSSPFVKDASQFYNPTIVTSSDDQIIRPSGKLSADSLTIMYSKPVKPGVGDIVIHNEDGSIARTIPVTDSSSVAFGSFDWRGLPAGIVTADVYGLPANKNYYATFNAGTFVDNGGNQAAGISDNTSLNFRIAPWGRTLNSLDTGAPVALSSPQVGDFAVKAYVPDGWASTHITMGQVWEGAPFSINNTLSSFDAGAYSKAMGSYFTYFGSGFAIDTRNLLTPDKLTTPKIQGLSDATQQMGGNNPVLVIYSNDFSTAETAANTVMDVSGPYASNQLANLALQSAAFEKQNAKNGVHGSILFSPDAIGAMAKNLIYNRVSPNSDWTTDPNAIIAVSGKDIYGNVFTKTAIDYKTILSNAVDMLWALKDNPTYKAILDFPAAKPDVSTLSYSKDITDYMMVQAWIIKQFAPKSELATVTNLWAGPWAGTSSMLTATDSQISDFAKAAADAYNSLGWQKANPYIDFIAFDKYERDETSVQVTKNQFGAQAFTEKAWDNSISFFNKVTEQVMPADKQAIMLWQIPASGLPSKSAADAAMLDQGWDASNSGGQGLNKDDLPHFGITESYFFGDKELAQYGLAQKVADITFTDTLGQTVKYGDRITAQGSGWSPETGLIDTATGEVDSSLSKVFAILWGGGNTSTPVSYRGSQWSGVSGNTGVDNSTDLNVKNKYGTAVLSIMNDLKAYDVTSRSGLQSAGSTGPIIEGIPGLTQTLDLTGNKAEYDIRIDESAPALSSSNLVESLRIIDLILGRNEAFKTSNVERLHFDDVSTALDLGGAAGKVNGLYDAILNRAGDKAGFGYWLAQIDGGANLTNVAKTFLSSSEASGLATKTNLEFVKLLYSQGLEREPDTVGSAFWVKQLNSGALSRADVAAAFASSDEQMHQVVSEVGTGIDFVAWAW